MNIIQLQDHLKNLSDQQLMMEMTHPTGAVPPYLALSEVKRRQEMRSGATQAPSSTVMDDLVGSRFSGMQQPNAAPAPVPASAAMGSPTPPMNASMQGIGSLPAAAMQGQIPGSAPSPMRMARGGKVHGYALGGIPQAGGMFSDLTIDELMQAHASGQIPDDAFNQEMNLRDSPDIGRIVQKPKFTGYDPTLNRFVRDGQAAFGREDSSGTPPTPQPSTPLGIPDVPNGITGITAAAPISAAPRPAPAPAEAPVAATTPPDAGQTPSVPSAQPPAPGGQGGTPMPIMPHMPAAPQGTKPYEMNIPSYAEMLQQAQKDRPDYLGGIQGKIDAYGQKLEQQASTDKALALMTGGLGVMSAGAKNPNFLGAIGQGGMPAVGEYMKARQQETANEASMLGMRERLATALQSNDMQTRDLAAKLLTSQTDAEKAKALTPAQVANLNSEAWARSITSPAEAAAHYSTAQHLAAITPSEISRNESTAKMNDVFANQGGRSTSTQSQLIRLASETDADGNPTTNATYARQRLLEMDPAYAAIWKAQTNPAMLAGSGDPQAALSQIIAGRNNGMMGNGIRTYDPATGTIK